MNSKKQDGLLEKASKSQKRHIDSADKTPNTEGICNKQKQLTRLPLT